MRSAFSMRGNGIICKWLAVSALHTVYQFILKQKSISFPPHGVYNRNSMMELLSLQYLSYCITYKQLAKHAIHNNIAPFSSKRKYFSPCRMFCSLCVTVSSGRNFIILCLICKFFYILRNGCF